MPIVHQSAPFLATSTPVLLLPAPPKRPALPAPKVVGYLPAPKMTVVPVKRKVEATITNPARLLDTSERDVWWAEIQRLLGPQKTQAERDADVLAYVFGTPAYRAQKDAENRAHREDMARFMAEWGLA